MRLAILSMLCILLPTQALSATINCKEQIKKKYPDTWIDKKELCYCGSQLSSLTVTLPLGLRVDTVCGLHFIKYDPFEIHWIDLTHETLSLDRYRNGSYPKGRIFLTGVTQLPVNGTVTSQPDIAGKNLRFQTEIDGRGPVFWKTHLTNFVLGTESDYAKLRAPTNEAAQDSCWEASAVVRIHDPVVLLGDTDEAGTGANLEVISVSEYKPCRVREARVTSLTKGQPEDVATLIKRIAACNYLLGEWKYEGETEKRERLAQIESLRCQSLPDDEKQIQIKYIGNANVLQAIQSAKVPK